MILLPFIKKKIKVPAEVKMITSCAELMLNVFIDCLIKEEYSGLILSGKPTIEQLQEAWNGIISEYAKLIGSEHYDRVFQLTKDINRNLFIFNRVESYVVMLEIQHSVILVKALKKFGYPGEYNPNTPTRYYKDLEAAYSKAKTLLMSAQQKQAELKKLESKVEHGKVDRRQFDENIISLSTFNKYQVQESQISVQKYALMMDSMNKFIQKSNQNSNGRAANRRNN